MYIVCHVRMRDPTSIAKSGLLTVLRMSWGILIFMSVLCNSFAKFMVVRFLLGAAEAM